MNDGHRPQRTCLGCRKALDKEALVRYVLTPDRRVVCDYRGKLPGRGAYTCIDRQCLSEAVRRKQFNRAFRGEVACGEPAELLEQLVAQVRERILALVGMARKSGQALSGSSLVLDTLGGGDLALVLVSEDISEAIGTKVATRANHVDVACFTMFDKQLLGQILGKGERSVLALKRGPLALTIKMELERYRHIAGEH